MLAPTEAFHQLEEFIETHEIRRAVILYSDTHSDGILDATLPEKGVTAELFVQHEKSADVIRSDRQADLIKDSIQNLIRCVENAPVAVAFKICSFACLSIWAILIDDKLLCAG